MARRIDPSLAAFVDPGPRAAFLRPDRLSWREVVARAFDVISDPTSRPERVRVAVGELTVLATAADECAAEVRREIGPN